MPVIPAGDLTLLRSRSHRSTIYGSFLKPLTLHTSLVNSGALTRGATSIPFDGGGGSYYAQVEAYQTLWVGTAPGTNDVAEVRIRSVASGDGGTTGTFTVAPNTIVWVNNQYLTVKHNYELWPMYPKIDLDTEVFYKDSDITYSNQNSQPDPAGDIDIWPRAQFIRNGEAVFWIDASNCYAVASGASVSSYALSVFPSTGVTTTFNTSTGIGYIVVTSTTQDYYWLKFTITDSNGKSQVTYRCVFVHHPDRSNALYPHVDFQIEQLSGSWERGGWTSKIAVNANSALADIPDGTYTILWKESIWKKDAELPVIVRDGNRLYIDPVLTYTITPSGANCDIDVTFHCGIMDDGKTVSDGTSVSIDFSIAAGGGPTNVSGTTTDSQVSLNTTFSGVSCSSSIVVENAANTVAILTQAYESGQVVSNSSEWPSILKVFPRTMIAGYSRSDNLSQNLAPGTGYSRNRIAITTIDDLLRNHFMFSISLEARPDGSVNRWYRYAKWLTIGRACHHIWRWHSTLMQVADVVGLTDNTDGRAYAEFEEGSLYSMADNMARLHGVRAHVVCNKEGKIHLTQDAQLLPDTPRGALTTAATITDNDKSGEVSILRNPEDRVAFVYTSGLVFSAAFSADERGEQMPNVEPYCSTAPGLIPSTEGQGTVDLDRQVITSQNHSNQIAGRIYAQVNNTYPEIRVKMRDYLDYLDIHLAEFWEIDIATGDTIREIALTDQKMIPRQVEARISGGRLQVDAVFEPEMESDDGVAATFCFDELPALPGIPELPTDGPGAIVTAGSVYYKAPTGDSWTLRTAEATSDIIQDPFWRTRQNTTNSSSAILLRGGVGFIKRSTDGGVSWSTVTPSNPPNDAGDSPAPTAADLDFKILDGSYATQSEFISLATWTAGGGERRSWLYFTDDDWATDSAVALAIGGNSVSSWDSATDITTSAEEPTKQDPHQAEESNYWVAKLSSTTFAVAFGATGGTVNEKGYVRIVDTSVPTVYSAYKFTTIDWDFGAASIVELSVNRFLVAYTEYDNVTDNAFELWLRAGQESSGVITWGTAVQITGYDDPDDFHLSQLTSAYALLTACENASFSDAIVVTISALSVSVGVAQAFTTDDVISCLSMALSSTKTVVLYNQYRPSGAGTRELKTIVANISGTTVNMASTTHSLATDSSDSPQYPHGVTLSSTTFLVGYARVDGGSNEGKLKVGSVSDTDTISFGSEVEYYNDVFALVTLDAFSSNRAVVLYEDSGAWGFYAKIITISGTTPSVGAASYFTPDDNDEAPKIRVMNSSQFFVSYKTDDPVDGVINRYTIGNLDTGEFDGLGAVIGRGSGAKAWVTGCDNSSLQLLEVELLPGLGILDYDLGSATFAQVDARTYYAIPAATFGNDDILYVAGRMNAPQGLSNPSHIIYSATGALIWSETEATWGADHCGAIYEAPDLTLFAVRNRTNQCKLYVGSAVGVSLRSTSSLNDGVDFHGLTVSVDAVALLAGKSADSILVVGSMWPYYVWTDLTADHGVAAGINAIEIL
jgi:hypothetical protein